MFIHLFSSTFLIIKKKKDIFGIRRRKYSIVTWLGTQSQSPSFSLSRYLPFTQVLEGGGKQ